MSTEGTPTAGAMGEAIPPAKRKKLHQFFEFGRANLAKGNIDYAADMFTRCTQGDPTTVVYGDSLIDTLYKKYNNNKKGAKLAGLKGARFRSTIKKSTAKEQWDAVAEAAIELVKLNPWDSAALAALSQACQGWHSPDAEFFYLRKALEASPKDPEINRLMARLQTRAGQFEPAIHCWHNVEKALPNDEEARKEIGFLTIRRTVGGSGAMPAQPADGPTEQAAPAEAEQEKAEPAPQLTIEQRLIAAIEAAPQEISPYIDLADHYAQESRFDHAEKVIAKAMAASGGGELTLRDRLDDYHVRRGQQRLEIAEQRAAKQATDEAIELVKGLRQELNRTELEIYARRCENNPANTTFHYELGVRLKRAGKFNEAIKSLQLARGDNKHKANVHLELGECFQHIRRYELALKDYEHAIENASEKELETRKLALYRAGVLAMGMKQLEGADKHLTELAGLDFGYKDVAERLDKLAQLRNNL